MIPDRKFGFQGLYSDSAALTAPPGALRVAQRVAIKRPGVITARERVAVDAGTPISPSDDGFETGNMSPTHIAPFQDRMVVFHVGQEGTITGTAQQWAEQIYTVTATDGVCGISTTIAATINVTATPTASLLPKAGYHTQSAEARNHLYIATADGVKRMQTVTSTSFPLAGLRVPDSLDPPTVTFGNRDTVYRVAVKRTLDTGLVLRSPPGAPLLDSTGRIRQYTVGFATGDTVEVYRSPDGFAVDEVQLAAERELTVSDITRGYVEIVDSNLLPLGANIYTAQTQEGVLQRNDRPPRCGTVAFYQNSMFFGNCGYGKEVIITLNPARQSTQWQGWPRPGFAKGVADAVHTSGSAIVTFAPGGQPGADVGMKMVAGFLPTGGASIVSFDTTVTFPQQYRLSLAATSTGTTVVSVYDVIRVGGESFFPGFSTHFTVATNDTSNFFMAKFANCVNRTSSNLGAEPLFTVGSNDTEPSSVRVYELGTVTSSSVYVTPRVGYRPIAAVDPEGVPIEHYDNTIDWNNNANKLTVWGGTPSSMEDTDRANRLVWSKPFQPEHVPRVNETFVGSERHRIQKLVPTRDALYILKTDGVWVLTGDEGGGNFPPGWSIRPLDPSLSLLTPDCAVAFEERVYGWFTRGLYMLSPAGAADIGVGRIDDKIEEATLRLSRKGQKSFSGAGLGYSSFDNEVYVHVPADLDLDRDYTYSGGSLEEEFVQDSSVYAWNTDTGTWVLAGFAAISADFPLLPGPLMATENLFGGWEGDSDGRVISTVGLQSIVELRGAAGMAPDAQKRFTDVLFYFDNANAVADVLTSFTSSGDDAEAQDATSVADISRSSGNSATVRVPVPVDHARGTELYPKIRVDADDWSLVGCTVIHYPYSKRVRR